MANENSDHCIEFIDVVKKFPGQYALKGISFRVRERGKSTPYSAKMGPVNQRC